MSKGNAVPIDDEFGKPKEIEIDDEFGGSAAPKSLVERFNQNILQRQVPEEQLLRAAINSPGDILNKTALPIANYIREKMGKAPAEPIPNLVDRPIAHGPGSFLGENLLPTIIGGEIAKPIEGAYGLLKGVAPEAASFGRKALNYGRNALVDIGAGATSGAATAPLYGMDPTKGAEFGAAIPAGLHGLYGLAKATTNPFQRMVLAIAKRGGLNTPEQGMQVLQQDYKGVPNVPIGNVANSTFLKGAFNFLRHSVPFSGAQKAYDKLEYNLAGAKADEAGQNIQARTQELQNIQGMPNPVEMVNKNANDQINELNHAKVKANTEQELSEGVKKAAEKNKEIDDALYSQVNDDHQIAPDRAGIPMPNYSNVAAKFLTNRENLASVFGTDNDVAHVIRTETDKAKHFLEGGGRENSLTVGEARTRTQQLGNAAESARQSGNWKTAADLEELKHAFKADWMGALEKTQPEMHKALLAANEWHSQMVTPFYKDNFKKAFRGETVLRDNLAADTLNPNYNNVWHSLPDQQKDMAIHLALTKGKGSIEGNYEGGANEAYSAFDSLGKMAKAKIAAHRPELAYYFDKLGEHLGQAQNVARANESQASDLIKQIESLRQQQQAMQSEQRLGASAHGGSIGKVLKSPAHAGGLGTGLGLGALSFLHPGIKLLAAIPSSVGIGRALTKALISPDVQNAFLTGEKLPNKPLPDILNKLKSGKARKGLLAAVMGMQNQGGQK